ncbi:hypothetical protein G7Z17_g1842 [Cylindrodendrum hubeiense]|uniref:Oligopeptide transporter n=1 Tax=Cylindrodendrum hubeiense TaxID=595255 RepID=A0A9P5LLN5_9HYPO|nr:hypothetical protein G7Z17_g1842 [Cylindrodendrum hubeiense]
MVNKMSEKDPLSVASPNDKTGDNKSLREEYAVPEDDFFLPFEGIPDHDPNQRILTVRSVILGALLGSLINCGNIYLGLKSGMGLESVLFATIFGFMIIKAMSKIKLPFIQDDFGPHENNILQAVAGGCVGLGFLYISAIPAMYQLGLLSDNPKNDYGMLLCHSLVAGFFGLSYTIALRKMFLIHLGRALRLIFPTGTAAAIVIRSLHTGIEMTGGTGRTPGKSTSARMPGLTFLACFIWPVVTQYAPGILYDWNLFWYIFKWGGHGAIYAVNWGWFNVLSSPAYIGVGMLMTPHATFSFFCGTLLAWGIVGPTIVKLGYASGIATSEKYPELMSYNAMIADNFATNPSPRYWILWPAVFLMLSTSITNILVEWRSLLVMGKYGIQSARKSYKTYFCKSETSNDVLGDAIAADNGPSDPILPQYQVRLWEWVSMMLISLIVALASFKSLYSIPVAVNILNMFLGILWSFVTIQTYGMSNMSPVATVAKASQFVVGGIMKSGYTTEQALLGNIASAGIAGGAAQQAATLMSDLKTGFLLKTPARTQFWAQAIGTLVAAVVTPALFILFCEAYPCILDPEALTCSFSTPAVASWRAVAIGIVSPTFPITKTSWVFAIILSLVGIATTLISRWLRKTNRQRFANFIPDMTLVGLAMTTPGTYLALTMMLGTTISVVWRRFGKNSFEVHGCAVAASGIAGESVGFVINAIFQIAEIEGPGYYGSMVGCVAESC